MKGAGSEQKPAEFRHLRELKTKCDEDLTRQVEMLMKEINALKAENAVIKRELLVMKKEVNGLKTGLVDQNAMLISTSQNNELALNTTAGLETKIYNKIVTEINRDLMPKFNNMAKFIQYHTQDDQEIINRFRYGLDKTCIEGAKGPKQISGVGSGQGPHLFFKN